MGGSAVDQRWPAAGRGRMPGTTLCSSTHWHVLRDPLLQRCSPESKTGRREEPSVQQGEQEEKDTARSFFQSSLAVCVLYRGYRRGEIDLHTHTSDAQLMKWWQEVLAWKAAVCTKESFWEIVPLLLFFPWPHSCACITYQTQCAARKICVAVFRHLQTSWIVSGRRVLVVLNFMLNLKALRSLIPTQVQDIFVLNCFTLRHTNISKKEEQLAFKIPQNWLF